MIIVNFENNEEYKKAYGLWQYDYGQVLRIQGLDLPTAVEMHFSLTETGGEAVTRIGITKDGVTDVTIPDSLLEADGASQDYQIYVFIYLATPDSGETTRRITLGVKSRPRPEVFDTPGEEKLFEGAVQAVNDAAKRAEEAGKEAIAAAGEARESASQAGKHLADTQALAEQVEINADVVAQGKEEAARLLAQTQSAASNAALSAETAKQSETAAKQAQTAAETAEDAARQYAAETEAGRQEVEKSKQSVAQIQSNVARMQADVQADREAVEQTVSEFGQTAQDALTAIGQAQNTAVSAVTEEGQKQATTVQEAGTQAVNEVDTAKTAAVGAVTAEGDKQVGRVREAAAEIVADREQIQQNQADIATLTDKTNTLAPGIVLDARGKQMIISDASEQPFAGVKVYGKSEQLVTTGAQLLNPALYDKDKTVNGVTFTKQADGSVILTGKSTGTSTFYLGEYVDVLEDGKTYIYGSGSPLGVINITYNDGTSNGYLNVITVDKSRMVSIKPYIQFSIEKPAPNNIRILPMFNEGTVIKPWEPYSGGKPSPNPEYPQKIVSAGDNGSITVEVTGRNLIKPNSYGTYYELSLKANTVVTLMTNGKLSDGGNIKFVATDGSDVWFSIDKGQTRVCRPIRNKDVKGFYDLLSMSAGLEYMFAVGNIKTYTPYVDPQSLTLATPNGLPGIPVKSGGNYTDSAGQQWVCDEIDLSEEERVRRIDIFERVTFTIHPNYEVEGSQLFRSDIKINDDELSGIQLPCMCNKMMKAPTVLIENKTGFYAAYGRIFARIKDVSDADTFNQMMADNVFLVQRPDPIVTPLSPEEIAAYKSLHTYSSTTIVTNDSNAGMSLTYIADTQRYIDKKIAAISAAMIGG